MKTPLLFIAAFILSTAAQAQALLYSEDFETGGASVTLNTSDVGGTATGINPWVTNNIYAGGTGSFNCPPFGAIPFTVPSAPQQPAGITNSPTSTHLHITPQIAIDGGGNLPAASYVAADGFCIFGGQSTFAGMNTDISTIGQDSVTLDLWWDCGGSTTYYGEMYYSTDGGSTWIAVINPLSGNTNWSGQVSWVNTVVSSPNWDGQATLRFGFRFVSGSTATGSELDPGFSIDDIEVNGYQVCQATSTTLNAIACNSYTSPSGNYIWTSSNSYQDTIPNAAGCDSVITVNLTINSVDNSVTVSGIMHTANQAGATYQWLDCGNSYAVINGDTNQSFTPSINGSYAVEITINGCTDTSSCYAVFSVGVGMENTGDDFSAFPNPTDGNININLYNRVSSVNVKTFDASGKLVASQQFSDTNLVNFDINGTSGLYFIVIVTDNGTTRSFKVVKK